MKLIEMKTHEYLEILASSTPAPGGGSASALSGAQGLALLAMVCNLTIGNSKYKMYEDDCKTTLNEVKSLLRAMCLAVDKDTEAYNKVSECYKIPKDEPGRAEKIEEAMTLATKVPFETMQLAIEGIRQVENVLGKTNPNAESDLGVALLNLKACLLGAWLNVRINLSSLKSIKMQDKFLEEGQAMVDEAEKTATLLYAAISRKL